MGNKGETSMGKATLTWEEPANWETLSYSRCTESLEDGSLTSGGDPIKISESPDRRGNEGIECERLEA